MDWTYAGNGPLGVPNGVVYTRGMLTPRVNRTTRVSAPVDTAPGRIPDRRLPADSQHVVHAVPTRRLARQELRRQQRPASVAVARVPLVRQLQRLAQRAEHDRVLAHVVPDPQGVHADLLAR